MDADGLKARTKRIGLEAIRLVESLPRSRSADTIARQLVRSATSVGANYRAACRSRSKTEFVAKLGVVEEEADESLYWMEMLADAGIVQPERLSTLQSECQEILRIIVASIKTTRGNNHRSKSEIRNPKSEM